MISYRTHVHHAPATPLGLLPDQWFVTHWCNLCRQNVPTDQLIAHAQQQHPDTDQPIDS